LHDRIYARLPFSALYLRRDLFPLHVHQVHDHLKVRAVFPIFSTPMNTGVRRRHILRGRHQFSQKIQAPRRRVGLVVDVAIDLMGFQGPVAVIQSRLHRTNSQQGQIVIESGCDEGFREYRPCDGLCLALIAHRRRLRLDE